MAWTAREEDDDKKEYFDSPEELDRKASVMADWIRESKHMIAFTGAGISTAAGIPDFRSGMDTKVETGPGVWELRAHKQTRSGAIKTKSTTQAVPTPTHMMLVKLVEQGLLKALISQNCDGLHRRSGIPVKALFELHGNSNVERCKKCKREYLRDYRVKPAQRNKLHLTGRTCDNPSCGGQLRDTIVNFGENLPEKCLDASFEHGEAADLCLAMGSSLTVTPAADIPETVGRRKRLLVIVNLQTTPLDRYAALRVFAKCDDFSKLLMEKLSTEIPSFLLQRRLFFKTAIAKTGRKKVIVEEVDVEGNPFSYLKRLVFGGVVSKACVPGRDALECEVPSGGGEVKVLLELQGHYGEPDVNLSFGVKGATNVTVDVHLSYDPHTGVWTISRSDQSVPTVLAPPHKSPVQGTSASKSPVQGTSASKSPVQGTSASKSPVQGTSKSPVQGTSKSPVRGASRSPVQKSPVRGASRSPVRGASRSPVQGTSKSTSKPPTQAASRSPVQGTSKSTSKSSKPPTQAASKSSKPGIQLGELVDSHQTMLSMAAELEAMKL